MGVFSGVKVYEFPCQIKRFPHSKLGTQDEINESYSFNSKVQIFLEFGFT